MPFWSSQTLEARAPNLIEGDGSPVVDCNAFQLRVGDEIFVTPHLDEANDLTKRRLSVSEPFLIPPQQFAFILTEERVRVPVNAMAFISMRATYKMQGLVNVSGFHVDPGWEGKLIFAVYNAGPSPVHLERGLRLFLIWYADLDEPSNNRKMKPGSDTIEPKTLSGLNRPTDSLYALNRRLLDEAETRKKAADDLKAKVHDIEKELVGIKVRGGILLGLVIAIGLLVLREDIMSLLSRVGIDTSSFETSITAGE